MIIRDGTVMHSVSDDECKQFWDWFQRCVDELSVGKLHMGWQSAWLDLNSEPVGRNLLGSGQKFINVLVGPFGFEARPTNNMRGYFCDRCV